MSVRRTIDARGCSIVATREEGSPIITVRGFPRRSGVLTWDLPSGAAMRLEAARLAREGETLELLASGGSTERPDAPVIVTYRTR